MSKKTAVIRGEEYTLRESGITLTTRLAGINFGVCQEVLRRYVIKKDILTLIPDEDNKHDSAAVMVVAKNKYMAGWIPNNGHTAQSKERIFKGLFAGEKWTAKVIDYIKPSREFNFYNVEVELSQKV